jgi:hypothetical protein
VRFSLLKQKAFPTVTPTMEFHISREFRKRLDLDELLFGYTGNVVFANVAASRKLAKRMNEVRGAEDDPSRTVNGGALFAMGLIDEMNHALVAYYRKNVDPAVLSDAVKWFVQKTGPIEFTQLLQTFTDHFPNVAVYRNELTPEQWLNGVTEGLPNREAALEELLLLWIANSNPAFKPFREMFEDATLQQAKPYRDVTQSFPEFFSERPPLNPKVGSLIAALRAPMLASPDSITGQLEFIRENWAPYLGDSVKRALLAIDTLREEDLAIWMRFNPPGPDWHRHGAGRSDHGFLGDEYIGFDDEWVLDPSGKRVRRYASNYQAPLVEYEAFSADQAWMPNVVLMAKSTYVWLEQLSQKYGRHIHRLDQIPDDELQLLARRGVTGLWLIGLWERSIASRTIKRLRGAYDAVASAYSLKEYDIAEDLGGNAAYEGLRDRAVRHGLRLASDMVPNHMGIDSNWVIEHPDWFLYRWESPFPVYSFNGPDLSTDSRVEIKIEDHYYDQSDAAVVFRLRHHADGSTRYMYHGNDGTTFAWNDTAQLDYSKAAVREHVIQTILHVARLFPIIRFDAAMVLAKRHVQRLWFPLPGAGGSIPSRAENAMSQEEFDALMPHEFWRDVVDRVAAEVPGTLLLAEAFWLLEGYFVRTLGMHRVYNSAFMNMMRDEENAKYRSYLKKTIEFDADILKRYVNFMSNPDERTAIDQFGSGDKYFGTCTLLATLPGLPMFGHGQIEGFTERYGMEFKQAKMQEWPNDDLVARHQHEIAPLLHNRRIFAGSENFTLYDFWTDYGTVDENVFAYSNRMGHERSLIFYNNVYGSTHGTVHMSVGFTDKGSGQYKQRSLSEGLALPDDDSLFIAYRDMASGLEHLCRVSDLRHNGLTVSLRGYQYIVLLHWRELRASEERPWDQLHGSLNGAGVYSLDETLSRLRLRPLHEALHESIGGDLVYGLVTLARAVAEQDNAKLVPAENGSGVNDAPIGKSEAKRPGVAATPDEQPSNDEQLLNDPRFIAFLDHYDKLRIAIESSLPDDSFATEKELGHKVVEVEDSNQPSEPNVSALETEAAVPAKTATDAEPNPASIMRFGRSREECGKLALAVIHLASRSKELFVKWPRSVLSVFPDVDAYGQPTQVWAPVLGWILLETTLPRNERARHFENLQLRFALAESFSSLGLEGERAWEAAARIHLLLNYEDPVAALCTEEFWRDPDVRWLAGVNEADGVTYINREHAEVLLAWIRLPELLRLLHTSASPAEVEALRSGIASDLGQMQHAGYKLDGFLSNCMQP